MTVAGQLNRRISLQRPDTGFDAIGQPVNGWTEVAPLWASIKHQSGMQAIRASADTAKVKASIRIRWRTGVTEAMRVVHGSTVYAIKSVLPDEAGRQHVDLVCEVLR